MKTLLEFYQRWDDLLALIGLVVVVLQAMVLSASTIAAGFGKLALMTQTKADDDFFAVLSLNLARVRDALVAMQRFLPRARLGPHKAPLVGTSIMPPPDPPPPAVPPEPVIARTVDD